MVHWQLLKEKHIKIFLEIMVQSDNDIILSKTNLV